MNYAIADIDGDGKNEILSGSGVYLVTAFRADGSQPTGWPKNTGGWVVATPAVGDLEGDGNLDVVALTREGWLWAWHGARPRQPEDRVGELPPRRAEHRQLRHPARDALGPEAGDGLQGRLQLGRRSGHLVRPARGVGPVGHSPPPAMSEVQELTLQHLWLPCTPMAGFPAEELLEVVRAEGPYIELADGRRLIDALSSWWCKPLGHGHPRLRAALVEQAGRFEQVIQAETTNATIAALSERLGTLVPGLPRVFYGGDGSMAVEIAIKLAVHAQKLRGRGNRQKLAALRGGYHGETQMALAVGDQSLYDAGVLEGIPRAAMLGPLPQVTGPADPLWRDCEAHWPAIERQLEALRGELCAVIVEPILQGAGEMRLYSPDLLARLRRWCTEAEVYLIADEILTGFGRTGRMLACEHAGVTADLICLSKGLTAGWLPLSAVLVGEPIYALLRRRWPAAVSALDDLLRQPVGGRGRRRGPEDLRRLDIAAVARALEPQLRGAFERIAKRTGRLRNIRALGGIVAADLDVPAERRGTKVGKQVCREAARRGALMRPLGDTLYWLPPLNVSAEVVRQLEEITADSIAAVLP